MDKAARQQTHEERRGRLQRITYNEHAYELIVDELTAALNYAGWIPLMRHLHKSEVDRLFSLLVNRLYERVERQFQERRARGEFDKKA